MAGNPTDNITISIYPATAIFSAHYVDALAGDGIDVTFTNSDCTIVSDHLTYDTETSMSGGNTLTITAYGHQYVTNPVNGDLTIHLPSQNLYAWKTTNTFYDKNDHSKLLTVYTLSETPSVGDSVYTATGEVFEGVCYTGIDTGRVNPQTISSINNNTMTVGR